MKKFYEKNEILFAVAWIILYCGLAAPIRGDYGDNSIQMLLALGAMATGITLFVRMNRLEGVYGLNFWPKDGKKFLYFIPMWFLTTGNLWGGFEIEYPGMGELMAVISMLLVGYVEEMIFRGFLFRAMLKKDSVKVAVTVSALTFGIGHIINLLTGQASVETVLQVVFAIAWGFIFTLVYYKSGSILPGILAHGLVDALSLFGRDSEVWAWVYMGVTIVVAAVYCPYLAKISNEK